MKKRIIFVLKALWIGGIETALVNLLNNLDYSRYDVTVMITTDDQTIADKLPEACELLVFDRINCVTNPDRYKFSKMFGYTEECDNPSSLHKLVMPVVPAIRWIENELYIRYISKYMSLFRYDTCIIYSDVAAEIAIRTVKADKYLMFYHHGAMRHVYHDSVGYKKCKKIFAVSHYQAEKLKAFCPEYKDKIEVINNLTDVSGIIDKAKQIPSVVFEDNKINIVSCGRVSHEKGMDIAVEVCGHLVASGYRNIMWWIIGGGPAEGEVLEKIHELGLEDYVSMLGMQNNPYPYIKFADLYVQPSRFEGYPMTILEALILGQPVISTDNTGAREIIEDGRTGVLCPLNSKDIAQTIEAIYFENNSKFEDMQKIVSTIDFNYKNRKLIQQFEDSI